MNNDWEVVYYQTEGERIPVVEFINSQEHKTQAKILAAIERLRLTNTKAGMPLVRPIEGKLWELRVELNTNIFRVFYFFWTGKQIVMLHAFQKKTQKTPNREIQVALKRMGEYQ